MASMARPGGGAHGELLRDLEQLFSAGTLTGLSDDELLQRFVRKHDEAAFAALIARHGPMVQAVCRRWLGSDFAAVDDAFQATFLVLVRKAKALRDGNRVGPWLYGVALRVARQARRRGFRDRATGGLGEQAVEATTMAGSPNLDWAELSTAIDEELERLPERLRAPVVLCYLQGLTHEQAAGQLRWPVGTVRSRMAAARAKLKGRLERRGLAGASILAVGSAHECVAVAPALASATLRLAMSVAGGGSAGLVPAGVAALTNGVINTMATKSLTYVAGGVIALVVATGGGIAAIQGVGAGVGTEGALASESEAAQKAGTRASDSVRDLEGQVETLRKRELELQMQINALQNELASVRNQGAAVSKAGRQSQSAGAGVAIGGALPGKQAERKAAAAGGMEDGRPAGVGYAGMGGMMAGRGGGGRGMMMGGSGMGGMMGGGGMAGMMGMGMGGMTGIPVEPTDLSQPISSAHIITMQPKNTNRVMAHSADTGRWYEYTKPKGVTAIPMIGASEILALYIKGEDIKELAVFNAKVGEWSVQPLQDAVSGEVTPIMSGACVAYAVGPRVYTYSAEANRWDSIELGEGAQPINEATRVRVEHEGKLAVFSAKTGTWSTFDVDAPDSSGDAEWP